MAAELTHEKSLEIRSIGVTIIASLIGLTSILAIKLVLSSLTRMDMTLIPILVVVAVPTLSFSTLLHHSIGLYRRKNFSRVVCYWSLRVAVILFILIAVIANRAIHRETSFEIHHLPNMRFWPFLYALWWMGSYLKRPAIIKEFLTPDAAASN
jgi:uncharacterized membrane protein